MDMTADCHESNYYHKAIIYTKGAFVNSILLQAVLLDYSDHCFGLLNDWKGLESSHPEIAFTFHNVLLRRASISC